MAVADDGATTTKKKKKFEALFPDPFMTEKQIQNGGFIVYLLGKSFYSFYPINQFKTVGIMYMFQGISLVTQNYINPAIDTIKKKGIVSESLFYFNFLYSYSSDRTL